MRRGAFGGSYGMGRSAAGGGGSGCGGGGGGGMFRNVGRVVRTGINSDSLPPSSSSSTHHSPTSPTKKPPTSSKHALLSLSSSTPNSIGSTTTHYVNSSINNCLLPAYAAAAWPLSEPNEFEVEEWECVEKYEGDSDCYGFDHHHVFGVVPSSHEVEHAILSLQQVMHQVLPSQFTSEETPSDLDKDAADVIQMTSSVSSGSDWIEPSIQIYDQSLAQPCGWERVYDAFHLLQTEPSVQKMVVSLSSDRAVWDAVLNNEAVREIRDSYYNTAEFDPKNSDNNSDPSNTNPNVLKWIFDNMKMKVLEVLGSITEFMGELLKPNDSDKVENTDAFTEKLNSTFLLTIVVLLIVVVSRGLKD